MPMKRKEQYVDMSPCIHACMSALQQLIAQTIKQQQFTVLFKENVLVTGQYIDVMIPCNSWYVCMSALQQLIAGQ